MKMLGLVLAISGRLHSRQLIQCRSCSSVSEIVASNTPKECGDEATPARQTSRLRQMALLVAYHGDRYYGMELLRKSGFPTVEEEVFGALQRSGAVTAGRAAYPPHYSRASRTDRGVSALGQVISLRMRVWDGVLDDINCHLPADIRICDMRRVPPRFSAQTLCDNRLYSYTLPTFAFTPMTETVTLDYRMPESRRQEVHQMFQQYLGIHSFHSFSPQGDPNSQQMLRRVMSIDVAEPYLADGLEFTTIWIRGGSFVLSQIRRMVGLVLAVCRAAAGRHAVRDALKHQRLTAVTAPGLGLILRQATFETFASAPWNAHGPLQWSDESATAVSHLEQRLLRHIHSTEAGELVTFQFIDNLLHNRVGMLVTAGCRSSFRSPLGYALVKANRLEGTPDPPKVAEVKPDSSEVTEVTLDPAEVTEVKPDPTEVTEVTPDPSDVTEVTPDSSEVTEVKPYPTGVTEATPDPSEVTEVKPDPKEVTEVTPDPSEVTDVREKDMVKQGS